MSKTKLSDLLHSDPVKSVAHVFTKARNKLGVQLINKNKFLQNCSAINQKINNNAFFKNLRIFHILKFFHLQSMTFNILNEYRRKKKIKKRLAARRAFIIRIAKANHAHQRADYETEKAILDQRLKEAIAALEANNTLNAQKTSHHYYSTSLVSSRQNQTAPAYLAAPIITLENSPSLISLFKQRVS